MVAPLATQILSRSYLSMPTRELVVACERFDNVKDDDWEFTHYAIVWKEGGNFHYVQHPERKFDLDALERPPPIPASYYTGSWDSGLTQAPNPLPTDAFVKTPSLLPYEPGAPSIGGQIIAEAQVLEILRINPHPNICTYYGCIREGDSVTGLCLKRYPRTLSDAVYDRSIKDENTRNKVLYEIAAGIEHLHSLGLIHNDINPSNIMLDEDNNAIIIDFDSCKREGEKLGIKGGTFMWCEEGVDTSLKANDIYGFKEIEKLLRGERVCDIGYADDSGKDPEDLSDQGAK
jgi:serine/threonine protein kinase